MSTENKIYLNFELADKVIYRSPKEGDTFYSASDSEEDKAIGLREFINSHPILKNLVNAK